MARLGGALVSIERPPGAWSWLMVTFFRLALLTYSLAVVRGGTARRARRSLMTYGSWLWLGGTGLGGC